MSDQRPEPPPYSPASGDAALEHTGATPLRPSDPRRLGPYVPLGLLGSGGMGRVYLARRADDGPGLAAVKVIRPEYAEDTEFRRRFQREAGVHDRVRTPYAPRLLGTGLEPEDQNGHELLWMATQYLPGLSLADAVRDCGTLPPAAAWRLVGGLGRALTALAAAGVVHRDLKPSNVLLSSDGVHVIDFGISQAVDSSAITTTGSRVGTAAYMSPEYLRDGRCDSASDVFSLAGTLVYAVTGHAPFGDGTGVDVMHRVAFEEPKPALMAELTSADPSLAALLAACLAKDPADRPTPAQLTEAATTTERPWPAPLNSRLLTRQQSCASLAHTPTRHTDHSRTPPQLTKPPTPTPGSGPPAPAGAPEASAGAHGASPSTGAREAAAPARAYEADTPPGEPEGPTPTGWLGVPAPPGSHGSPAPSGGQGPPTPGFGPVAPAGAYGSGASTGAHRADTPPGGPQGPAPVGGQGTPTPAGGRGSPAPSGGQGAATPPGVYGAPVPVGAYGVSTPPGAYGTYMPSSAVYGGPGGGQGVTSVSVRPRRKKRPYFVVVAALVVCAVVVGGYFAMRPATDGSVSVAPTGGATTVPDGEAAAPLPGSSDSSSPSASAEKEDEESPSADPTPETAGPTPSDAAAPTSGGSSDGDDGDTAKTPTSTPTPTKTATKPATPAWISQCTYYSGTELTDRGDEGQRVVQVQCMLQQRGYSVGGSGVDGKFGKDTEAAVRQFQSAKGLEVDGQVGPNTWAALRGST